MYLKSGRLKSTREHTPLVIKRTHKGELRDVLATNMRRYRATRKLTQEALAFESGINRTYLSAVERSERNVSIDNVERIARGLGVDAWLLLKKR